MNQTPTYLNQYTGYDANNNPTVVVAEDMETAVHVYNMDKEEDPVQMQTTKKMIRCVLPETYTTFTAVAYDPTGGAITAGCRASPAKGTVVGGTKQYFEAIAGEGWKFVKWEIDGIDVDEGLLPIMQLTVPVSVGGQCVIKAIFEEDA